MYRESWDALARSANWPLAEFNWTVASAEHLESDRDVLAVLVLQGKSLVGAILLAGSTENHRRFMRPVGFGALGESNVLLAKTSESEARLVEHLVSRRQPFVLPRVLSSNHLNLVLNRACRNHGFLIARKTSGSPTLDLRGGMEQINARFSASRRYGMRRKLKNLNAMGEVKTWFVTPSEDEVVEYLHTFEQLEDKGWKGNKGSSILKRRGFHDFFLTGLKSFARDGRIRFDAISLRDHVIAIQMGIVSNGSYFLLKPTYDESLATLSPGHLLTYAAIKQSVNDGLTSYELLGGEDEWKLRWASSIRDTTSWIYYPLSLDGALTLSKDLLQRIISKYRKKI